LRWTPSVLTEELTALFFEEAATLLAEFEAALLRLERDPRDTASLDAAFRGAHSFKGNSAMMGFTAITRLTHSMESLLDRIRTGARPLGPAAVETLLRSKDALTGLVAAAREGGAAPEPEAAAERVREALETLLAEAPAETVAQVWEIVFQPSADVLLRGVDPLTVLEQLGELGEVMSVVAVDTTLPPLATLDPERCYLGWRIWLRTARARDEIDTRLDFAAGAGTKVSLAAADEPTPAAPIRPRLEVQDDGATVRLPIEKLDALLDLVGELITTHAMVALAVGDVGQDRRGPLGEAVTQMDRQVRDLHDRMLACRMVPVRTLFARFPRLVRDLGTSLGKSVTLELTGEDTELDRSMIERIADPLAHLVRNAIGHGLETPEARRRGGKKEVGVIRLAAWQQDGRVCLEVRDDGAGLDRERIVARARERGLVGAGESLSDEAAVAFIFHPGFSTAERVTELSGRGVGLDVVQRSVEALGGTVTVRSRLGHGATFRITLPLTMVLLDGQLLRVGEQTFVLPLVAIVESILPAPGAVHVLAGGAEVLRVRDAVVPLLRLRRLLGGPNGPDEPGAAGGGLAVIVEHPDGRRALLVDELLSQQQVVIKSLDASMGRLPGLAGATILGDGRVALILDVHGLIASGRAV